MYCEYCGNKIEDNALFCGNCGARVERTEPKDNDVNGGNTDFSDRFAPTIDKNKTERSFGISVLTFFFPIVGLILYLVWRKSREGLAISAGKGALVSLSVSYPILGLVFFLVFREKMPEISKACGIAAIVGVAVGVIIVPVFTVALAIAYGMMEEGAAVTSVLEMISLLTWRI